MNACRPDANILEDLQVDKTDWLTLVMRPFAGQMGFIFEDLFRSHVSTTFLTCMREWGGGFSVAYEEISKAMVGAKSNFLA
jgi:hypothetical protein